MMVAWTGFQRAPRDGINCDVVGAQALSIGTIPEQEPLQNVARARRSGNLESVSSWRPRVVKKFHK